MCTIAVLPTRLVSLEVLQLIAMLVVVTMWNVHQAKLAFKTDVKTLVKSSLFVVQTHFVQCQTTISLALVLHILKEIQHLLLAANENIPIV